MGIFSNLLKPKTRVIAETPLGNFELTYSKRDRNIWTSNKGAFIMSIRGTNKEPDKAQLSFLANVNEEILTLDKKITKRFIKEFKEAGLETNFTDWKEQFKIVAIEIMMIFQEETYWNITFEDLHAPYAHFTLYIEGARITDFSIDT